MPGRIGQFLTIYKRGQGTWSRGVAALGLLAMGTYGGVQTGTWLAPWRLVTEITVLGMKIPVYYGIGLYLPVGIFLVFGALTVYACNAARPADLLIETEIEMRKVTWPTTREVLGATVVVIIVVLILSAYLYSLDFIYVHFILRWLGAAPPSI